MNLHSACVSHWGGYVSEKREDIHNANAIFALIILSIKRNRNSNKRKRKKNVNKHSSSRYKLDWTLSAVFAWKFYITFTEEIKVIRENNEIIVTTAGVCILYD